LAHARILTEVSVQGLIGHVVGILKWPIVDVGRISMVDGVKEGRNFPANVIEIIEPIQESVWQYSTITKFMCLHEVNGILERLLP
jgi:hypothetical protein